ncbi:MAG: hypothetical protein DHS20C15_19560 [Planctomycetota bacterium]|nr:MAG: hypothetical protein DHS20C15_19560 [Planctomycetota bacterium]
MKHVALGLLVVAGLVALLVVATSDRAGEGAPLEALESVAGAGDDDTLEPGSAADPLTTEREPTRLATPDTSATKANARAPTSTPAARDNALYVDVVDASGALVADMPLIGVVESQGERYAWLPPVRTGSSGEPARFEMSAEVFESDDLTRGGLTRLMIALHMPLDPPLGVDVPAQLVRGKGLRIQLPDEELAWFGTLEVLVLDAAGDPVGNVPIHTELLNPFTKERMDGPGGWVTEAQSGVARLPLEQLGQTLAEARLPYGKQWQLTIGAPSPIEDPLEIVLPEPPPRDAPLELRLPPHGWYELQLRDQLGNARPLGLLRGEVVWGFDTTARSRWGSGQQRVIEKAGDRLLLGPVPLHTPVRVWSAGGTLVNFSEDLDSLSQHGELRRVEFDVLSAFRVEFTGELRDLNDTPLDTYNLKVTLEDATSERALRATAVEGSARFELSGPLALVPDADVTLHFAVEGGSAEALVNTHGAEVSWSWDGKGEPTGPHELGVIQLPALDASSSQSSPPDRGPFGRVAGRVIDEHGAPLAKRGVTLVGIQEFVAGELFRTHIGRAHTDQHGRFEFAPIDPMYERVAFELDGQLALRAPLEPVAVGSLDVLLQAQHAGSMLVSTVLPSDAPQDAFRLFWSGEGRSGEEELRQIFGPARAIAGLPPGTIRVTFGLHESDWRELVVVPGVRIEPGERTEDPRLLDVDLTQQVQRLRLRLLDTRGAPIRAEDIRVVDNANRASASLRSDAHGMLDALVPVDIEDFQVRVAGYEHAWIRSAPQRQELVLADA